MKVFTSIFFPIIFAIYRVVVKDPPTYPMSHPLNNPFTMIVHWQGGLAGLQGRAADKVYLFKHGLKINLILSDNLKLEITVVVENIL